MTVQVPNKTRIILYVLTGLAAPVVAYLNTKGVIDANGVQLFSAEVSFVSAVAAFKAFDFKSVEETVEPKHAASEDEPTFDHLG